MAHSSHSVNEIDHLKSVLSDLKYSSLTVDNEITQELQLEFNEYQRLVDRDSLLVFENVVLNNEKEWSMVCIGYLSHFDIVFIHKLDESSLSKFKLINEQLKDIGLEVPSLNQIVPRLRSFDAATYSKLGLI